MGKHNEERSDTAAESKSLKRGRRVYWRGDATDDGNIAVISWDAVTIVWDDGQVATVHHGDMHEIQRMPAEPTIVYGPNEFLPLAFFGPAMRSNPR